jgi:hypothetical protein
MQIGKKSWRHVGKKQAVGIIFSRMISVQNERNWDLILIISFQFLDNFWTLGNLNSSDV